MKTSFALLFVLAFFSSCIKEKDNSSHVQLVPNSIGYSNPMGSCTPIVWNNNLYFTMSEESIFKNHLVKFDGVSVYEIPNSQGCFWPVLYKDKLYFRGEGSIGGSSNSIYVTLKQYDGNTITNVPNDTVYYSGWPIVWNDCLYFQSDNQLAKYDGNTFSIIQNSRGYSGCPIIWNNILYFNHHIDSVQGNTIWQLAKYDGNSVSIISNPDNSSWGFSGGPISIFNNSLYFSYIAEASDTFNGTFKLAKYDGNSITIISNEDEWYYGGAIVWNNYLYMGYPDLVKYDGATFTQIDHNSNSWNFTGYQPLIFNNYMFFFAKSENIPQLAKFDGTTVTLFPNPDKGKGCHGDFVIFNNKIYFSYINSMGYMQLASYE